MSTHIDPRRERENGDDEAESDQSAKVTRDVAVALRNDTLSQRMSGVEGRLDDHAKWQGETAAVLGLMRMTLERIDRRTELTDARVEGLTLKLGHVDQITDANREQVRKHNRIIQAIRERNEKIDTAEAERRAKLEATVEHLKADVKELEEDLEDTQNRRLLTAEGAAAALVTEAFRAKLSSQADDTRESRADIREDRRHVREEQSKTKWWLLGLIGFAVLTFLGIGAAALKSKLGVEAESPPLPALPTHGK